MSSIKVVDVNNEEDKQEEPTEQIEEVNEELPIVDTKEEEPKEEPKEIAVEKKVSPQDKMVRCPKCNKEMKLKSFRYNHEKTCSGTLEQKAVKPFSKPRAKPKPKAQPIVQDVEEEIIEEPKPKLTQPVSNQILKPQPSNPLADITNHYQLLQQQFIQQKKEKYNNLCQNMFASRSRR